MLNGEVDKIFGFVGDYLLQELLEYVVHVVFLQILLYLLVKLHLFFSVHKLQLFLALKVLKSNWSLFPARMKLL